jgi:Raf kinase inhibitor-like YbhB/YbcL family protein
VVTMDNLRFLQPKGFLSRSRTLLVLVVLSALALAVSSCGPEAGEEGIDDGNFTEDDGIIVVDGNETGMVNDTGGAMPLDDEGIGEAGAVPDFTLGSQSFEDGEEIPSAYTCDADELSPELSWDGLPEGTESMALIMEDPDAPGGLFTHWVVYNIPPQSGTINEGAGSEGGLPMDAVQGVNEVGMEGYMGPCPPTGTHRYVFRMYALDEVIDDPGPVDRQALLDAMEGHVLGEAAIMGTYTR